MFKWTSRSWDRIPLMLKSHTTTAQSCITMRTHSVGWICWLERDWQPWLRSRLDLLPVTKDGWVRSWSRASSCPCPFFIHISILVTRAWIVHQYQFIINFIIFIEFFYYFKNSLEWLLSWRVTKSSSNNVSEFYFNKKILASFSIFWAKIARFFPTFFSSRFPPYSEIFYYITVLSFQLYKLNFFKHSVMVIKIAPERCRVAGQLIAFPCWLEKATSTGEL